MVIEDPLDFNMLLGRDYVYAMQAVVSTFFHVMCFNHGEEIVTIDQLDFLDPSPDPASLSFIDSQCFYRHYPATGELCGLMSFAFNCY